MHKKTIPVNLKRLGRIGADLYQRQSLFSSRVLVVDKWGGEILSVGTYREKWGDDPICYLRVREGDPEKIAEALRKRGYTILSVHV